MKRSKMSLSNYKLATMPLGKLIPVNWFEVIPGDSVQQATSALVRVTPLAKPIMHPVIVRIHHWFCPNRLVWTGFEDFITGGPDGLDASVHPYVELGTVGEGTIYDYLGIPPATYSSDHVSALPFRVYDEIFNQHYRDQDLVTELTIDKTNGLDSTTDIGLQYASWPKDYFTTSRPWAQKGSGVTIPLGSTADVIPDPADTKPTFTLGGTGSYNLAGDGSTTAKWDSGGSGTGRWDNPALLADLSGATGIDIADLRLALSIQRYQEARAKYGSRYVEYLRYLGVRSSDARLSIPEYLGGGRQVIQFSEVLGTGDSAAGQVVGHGIAAMRSNRYRRFFEEHGIVMTLMSVVPKAIYANGLHRSWTRTVKEDYYTRELAQIGEQEVLNKEVYSEHSSPDGVFGYQARYDEYRSLPSTVHSEFRTSENDWHYARIFGSDPSLNSTFVNCVPTTRVYQSAAVDPLQVMINHSIQARRPMAKSAKTRTF